MKNRETVDGERWLIRRRDGIEIAAVGSASPVYRADGSLMGAVLTLRDDTALTEVPLPPHELWITETGGLLDAFVDSVVEGAPLQCSAADHILSLAMVEACARSSRERNAISIAEILEEGGYAAP